MTSSTPRCLVRGSINVDEFFSLPHIVKPGETISSTGFTRKPGGKGANQAYALAKAGAPVDLEGSIGLDGVWIKDLLKEGGVGVGRLNVVEGEVTGRAVIQSAADGENSIVLHKGANFSVQESDDQPDLKGYTHLLLQNEIPLSTTLRNLTTSKDIISIFNPSPMLTPDELAAFPWEYLSWLIVNEGELETLLDTLGNTNIHPSGDIVIDAEKRIQALHTSEKFNKTVSIICTLGSKGILHFRPGSRVGKLDAANVSKVRDTTGAGDCFAGYFAAGLMRHHGEGDEGLEDVLKECLNACAICVESPGAMESYPTRQEVLERMKR